MQGQETGDRSQESEGGNERNMKKVKSFSVWQHLWVEQLWVDICLSILVCMCCAFLFSCKALADEDPYIIGVEDELFISAWDNAQLTLTVTVRPDGKISYPLLRDIQAEGLTPENLAENIQGKLAAFINKPVVTVTVSNINSLKVYVFGEVQKPGIVTLKRKTTILQFLSLIGGVMDTADLTKASLIRKNQTVDVNFYRLLKEGDLSQNIDLQKDDTILIPDNFDRRITIVGEVKNPKVIHFRKELNIMDAILEAGGFTEYAKTDRVKISRRFNSQKKILEVDFKAMLKKAKSEMNIPLMPGDTIIVPESLL
jgi:polysaccharide export outer membrane protein